MRTTRDKYKKMAMKKKVRATASKLPYMAAQARLAADGVAMNMEYTGCSSLGSASLVGSRWYSVTNTTM
uniref:Uncharacterized protein n=1 Tax=Arundo donax TaxID=35708 RepID=A0A0A8Z5X7_ARUDO